MDIISTQSLRKNFLDFIPPFLASIRGDRLVASYLGREKKNYPYVLALGKAAGAMIRGACKDNTPHKGLLITKYGHSEGLHFPWLRIIESGHPVPDENSLRAGKAVKDFCRDCAAEPLLCLISGGASALVELLQPNHTLADLQTLNEELLARKLPIAEINRRRMRLSQLKGGGLARMLSRSLVLALYLSDVAGNSTEVIGSGLLADSEHPSLCEHILADNAFARAQATEIMGENYETSCHDSLQEGAVEEVAERMAERLRVEPGVVHIWGGEPLVDLPPRPGQGGRNQHLALLMAKKIAGQRAACFLSLGTDGTDGNTSYAGGMVTGESYAELKPRDYQNFLAAADAARALTALGGIIRTGPTGTNLMDLMMGYVSK